MHDPSTDITGASTRRSQSARTRSLADWDRLLSLVSHQADADDLQPEGGLAVEYLRVSTTRQMNTAVDIDADGNSIATQREFCDRRAKGMGVRVVQRFIEPGHSAQTVGKRPVFREMVRFLSENPEVRYVIIYMRSRVFRNQADAAVAKKMFTHLGIRLISAKEEFGEGYMADAMEAITDITNEVQVRQSGEDIRQKMLHKAKSGGTLGRARIGYLNVRKDFDDRLVNTVEVDAQRAPLIRWAFEAYATGEYSITRLQQALTEQGLKTRPTAKRPGAPLSRPALALLLRDPYYIGFVRYKGETYQGRHEPLISAELFERVSQVLDERVQRSVRDRIHRHFLRGLLQCRRCAERGVRQQLIYTQAKNRVGQIYEYYVCPRRTDGGCDLPHIPVAELEKALEREIQKYTITDKFLSDARASIQTTVDDDVASQREVAQRLRKELRQLEEQEERLIELAADGTLQSSKIRERLQKLQVQQAATKERLHYTDNEIEMAAEALLLYLELMHRPDVFYRSTTPAAKSRLLRAFYSRIEADFDPNLQVHVTPQPQVAVIQAAMAKHARETRPKPNRDHEPSTRPNGGEKPLRPLLILGLCSNKAELVGRSKNRGNRVVARDRMRPDTDYPLRAARISSASQES